MHEEQTQADKQRRFLHCIINSLIVFLSRRPSTSVDYRSEIFLV